MDFSTDTLLRTWQCEGFRIELHRVAGHNHRPEAGVCLGYRVFDDTWAAATGADPLVFTGHDLGVPEGPVDLPRAVNALCGFFSYQHGDIPDGYFTPYTPAQLAWRDARARDLAPWGSDHMVATAGATMYDRCCNAADSRSATLSDTPGSAQAVSQS